MRFLQQQMPMPLELQLHQDGVAEAEVIAPEQAPAERVLVIDGELSYRNAIRRVLFDAGYQLDFAADGFQAGVKILSSKPDLITLDLSMPGLDGFEVLKFIREQPELAAVRILVISALELAELEKARPLGADALLAKPFENEQLLQLVQQLLHTRV